MNDNKPFEKATAAELKEVWDRYHEETTGHTAVEVVPAEALKEPPENMKNHWQTTITGDVGRGIWSGSAYDFARLMDARVFPLTPEGKAGAEKRKEVPHPGINWKEDVNRLWGAYRRVAHSIHPSSYLAVTMDEFVKKYSS